MNTLQLNEMEEILTIPNNIQSVTISSDVVLHYLYCNSVYGENKQNLKTKLNVCEVRKKYIDILHKFYADSENCEKRKNITFNSEDLKKIKM